MKYNGWTNYETWRVNLELFDTEEFSGYTAEALKEYAESVLECENPLAESYALAFLNNVNWYEIEEKLK